MTQATSLPGRACGTCTLCCKVLSIAEIEKPQGQWCRHCAAGIGCKIYDERPSECRSFYCGYLSWPLAGDHWHPARSKMVIVSELDGHRVAVHVDPGKPGAWRDPLYRTDLTSWAHAAAQMTMQVVVMVGRRAIVILPDREVDLGVVSDEDRIITWQRSGPDGIALEAVKLRFDDPRIAGIQTGKPFSRRLEPWEALGRS